MNERKKFLLCALIVIIYSFYSIHKWLKKDYVEEYKADVHLENQSEIQERFAREESEEEPEIRPEIEPNIDVNISEKKSKLKSKIIPLYLKNACSILDIFTKKTLSKCKDGKTEEETDNNAVTVIGITIFLVILAVNAVLDVIKVKEEERARRKLNPDGERRQSLAEFANKKMLRRDSSKFGLQMFQIAEATASSDEEKKCQRQTRPYRRGDSTNSYLSDRNTQAEGSGPASISETSTGEPKLVKRQSVAKLFVGRPVPMVRRSSFPVLPLNPDVQALMLGHRQPSLDSDDEGDGRGRRVRLIRRF